jgi:four helix bundle protein
MIKSSTSVGANYRAACRARSKAEFIAKVSIVLEEADETLYWLEILEGIDVSSEALIKLKTEALELVKIFSSTRKTARNN